MDQYLHGFHHCLKSKEWNDFMKKGKIFAICIVVCLILIFAVYSNKKVKGVKLFGFAKPEKMTIEMVIGSVRNKVMADKDKEKFISYLNNAGYKKVKSELIEGVSVLYIKSKEKKWQIGIAGSKVFYNGKCYEMDREVINDLRELAGF